MFGGDKVWRIASSKVVGKKSLANALRSLRVKKFVSLANTLLFAKLSPAKLSRYTVHNSEEGKMASFFKKLGYLGNESSYSHHSSYFKVLPFGTITL